MDEANTDRKNVEDLFELLELQEEDELPDGKHGTTAAGLSAGKANGGGDAAGGDAAGKASAEPMDAASKEAAVAAFGKLTAATTAVATRPGTLWLLMKAAVEWRRQKRVQDVALRRRRPGSSSSSRD